MPGRSRTTSRGVLLGLTWALACSDAAPPQPTHRLLPETRGQIESVALSVTSGRRAALRNADIVSRLVDALPAETRVRILTNDREAFTVRQPRTPLRSRDAEFVPVDPVHALTIWPQDPFLVMEGPGGTPRLLRSKRFERADDRVMADALAEHAGWDVSDSRLDFEGGNLAADEKRVYIGANTIRWNALQRDVRDARIARAFEDELGLPVVVVGPVPQPIAHLDMYLTPLPDDRVLLADPGAGADLVRATLEHEPDAIRHFERAVRAWFFGDPRIARLPGEEGTIEAPDLEGRTSRAVRDSEALAGLFDALGQALEARGLKVQRVPLLLTASPATGTRAAERERPYAASLNYPILTYNNVVQEERGGRRRVWLPQYGLAVLDAAGRNAWEALGYEVVSVDGYATSALYGGALRCSAKVTERSIPPRQGDPAR